MMAARRKRKYAEHYPVITAGDFKHVPIKDKPLTYRVEGVVGSFELMPKRVGFGVRRYLVCNHCEKLREKLFIVDSALACRECHGLSNKSNTMSEYERLRVSIIKRRRELWSDHPAHKSEIYNLLETSIYWLKPKGIHWKTFNQKRNELFEMEYRYLTEYVAPSIDKIVAKSGINQRGENVDIN